MAKTGLGRKFILLAVMAALLYSATLLGIYAAFTLSGFIQLEASFIKADLGRIENYLTARTDDLSATASDYATWDDARSFLQGRNPGFVEENFTPETLANLGIAYAAIYRLDGSLAVARSVEPSLDGLVPHRLQEGGLAGSGDGRGRLLLGGRAFIAASAPVTSSDGSAPSIGTLIMARAVDAAFVGAMGTDLGLSLASGPVEKASLGFDPALLGEDGSYVLQPRGSREVRGYLVLKDGSGSPFLLVRVEAPRRITAQAHRVGYILLLASPLLLLFVAAAGWAVFRLLLESPLRRLEGILESEAPGEPKEDVDRELAAISEREDAIGRMASVIRESRRRYRESSDAVAAVNGLLEREVESRTTELRNANHNLRLYRRIMEGTSEGVVVTDLAGDIIETNEAFCRMAGYEASELVGRNPRVLKSDRHPPEFYQEMWASILGSGQWSGEVWDRRKNGEVYPKWMSINTICDDEGRPESYVGICADISRVKEAEERLSRMVFYDSLTGLPNRVLFRDRLQQSIVHAQRASGNCALLFVDLDRFKNVNDSLGHLVGDELLSQVSKRILGVVRGSDTVSRLGGDEFTVILDDVSRVDAAGEVAAKVIRAVRQPYRLSSTEVYVGASVGIAVYPIDGLDIDTLIMRADAAMYEAKERGRGQYRFASSVAGDDSRRRIEVEGELRRAIEQGRLRLHYQPQVAAGAAIPGSCAGIVGAEALIRMSRADGSIVSPGEFMDVAEDSGLVMPLGEWALGEACREAYRWSAAGKPLVVSVNVSTRQFERDKLVASVRAALDSSGLPPGLLKLEVTESLFMRNLEHSVEVMREIRSMGVSFAVDDFGIGFSSLQYLTRLPLDCLKIDKAFVDDVKDDFDGGEIVTAVIALARSFGLTCVAEGVETEAQLEALRRRGCDEFQGYLISRPLDADAFMRFIGAGVEA